MFGLSVRATALVAITLLLPNAFGWSFRRLEAARYQAVMSANEPTCTIEHGFDYVGNDIANVPGAYNDCCAHCASVAECAAWTWTNADGGTCWLKWAQGKVVANANAKSAPMFPWIVDWPTCDNYNDTDFVGNDLARVSSEAASGCCDLCKNYLGCRAYSWTNDQNGSCWLKSEATEIISKVGVKSSRVYTRVSPFCSFPAEGYDSDGNDIGNKPVARVDDCCSICQTTRGCRTYTWSNYQGGTCWLKGRRGNVTRKAGVFFSQVYPDTTPPYCVIQKDVDYVGNHMANAPGKDPEECCNKCRSYNGCKAWTWSDFNNGSCWFKSQQGTKVAKSGVSSGIV